MLTAPPPSPDLLIHDVRVVTPAAVIDDATVLVVDGRIAEIAASPPAGKGWRRIHGRGRLLLPGFIDLHSDVIENAIQPRPGGRFPVDVALHELDKQLVACGVTSIYHCLCFLPGDENPPFRSFEMTDFLINEIHALRGGFHARTRIHARYEITNSEAFGELEALVADGRVDFLSLMDHTPGQGQFSNVEHFRSYYSEARGLSQDHVDLIIERRLRACREVDWGRLAQLTGSCREHGIRMASHDDDCAAKVAAVHRLGVGLSEFPVNFEAARAARGHGMLIALGSPNVLRGASLTGNLSGREALAVGLGDILCSDYAPMSLLHAAMQVHRDGILDLPAAVALITLNPARATGTDRLLGSIEPGKSADLVLVDDRRPVSGIQATFVEGREVYRAGD
jgi:alpha-D-ribose 1-methylphosphonate 5-triphosphate diphosphatase